MNKLGPYTFCLALLAVPALVPAARASAEEADPKRAARALLERLDAKATLTQADRLGALRALAGLDTPSALAPGARIAAGLEPGPAASRAVSQAWAQIVSAAVDDGPSRLLAKAWPSLPAPLRRVTVRTLTEHGTRSALGEAMDLAALTGKDVPALLAELRRAAPVVAAQVALVRYLRRFARDADPQVRAAAAESLGRAADADASKELVKLLADDDASVRQAAHGGLRALTKARSDPSAWRQWLDGEERWQRESNVEDRLQSSDVVEVARALKELARHRLVALRLHETVARLVRHRAIGIRLMAYATLRRTATPAAAAGLVDGLDDSDERVRKAVWQTLKALSGEDLPLRTAAWKAARRRWRS